METKPMNENVALVTGAAMGIGLACAEAFAKAGYMTVMADLKEPVEQAVRLANEGCRVRTYACDVSDGRAVKQMIEQIAADYGRLDTALNNAGIQTPQRPMAEITIPVVGLGVDAALMYSQRGKDYDMTDGSETFTLDAKQQGLEIPINLKYTIGLGSLLGIYVAAGPDFFFNFKDVNLKGFGESLNADDLVDSKKAQVAINLGAGVKLIKHLQIGFNYQIPLGDSFSAGEALEAIGGEIFGAKTRTWQISAAYIF